jgi:hypothetical protein
MKSFTLRSFSSSADFFASVNAGLPFPQHDYPRRPIAGQDLSFEIRKIIGPGNGTGRTDKQAEKAGMSAWKASEKDRDSIGIHVGVYLKFDYNRDALVGCVAIVAITYR